MVTWFCTQRDITLEGLDHTGWIGYRGQKLPRNPLLQSMPSYLQPLDLYLHLRPDEALRDLVYPEGRAPGPDLQGGLVLGQHTYISAPIVENGSVVRDMIVD